MDEADVKGEVYDLIGMEHSARTSDDEITVFENGGGTDPALMIADFIAQTVRGKA
jgi:hypothetical protein